MAQTAASATPMSEPRHARGMWVWGTSTRVQHDDALPALLETCRMLRLTEVYLSINGVLDDPRLPAFVEGLRAAGIRVEALMGEARWYQAAERPAMFAKIDAVATFNAKHPPGFSAVHLDVEPHQLKENEASHAFLPELAFALTEARLRAASFGLGTSADLPRFALDEDGPAFASAVPRIFVMLYQLRDRSSSWLVRASRSVLEHAFSGVPSDEPGELVVALRVEDYPETLETMLDALDGAHGASLRYGGWAVHDEAKYRARR
ncbi:hypothetical protein [Labilithrix luteola]|uniref:hypothetical protein n=1 Tax=Labilithrix luteola TaxID=1391654 RepID=UPI0011BAE225|nr:hypothetical protein [Labilithrix luteola]